MIQVGIEAMNVFGGTAFLDVPELAARRQLDTARFENLMMLEKTVALSYEDPITFGVNAAKPIVDSLSEEERNRIELVITCTESGIDFGKSMSTYIHHYLGLNRRCRMYEIKQACYSGTAGLHAAVQFILSGTSPGAKALVIATDISRFFVAKGGSSLTEDWSYAELSAGAGAVALLVSDTPYVFQIDTGASGYYGYEVMDTCRPMPDSEAGNSDLSLSTYLDCCEQTFMAYKSRVPEADYKDTFQYLAFHTPFGGMVKGAHRTMMRRIAKAKAPEIDADFNQRVLPGIRFCQRVGNIMGGTVFLSLAGLIEHGTFDTPKRIGCYSYGSGCCSEFYSGVATSQSQAALRKFKLSERLQERRLLGFDEYEAMLRSGHGIRFGTRNAKLDLQGIPASVRGEQRLYLEEIRDFHRIYRWL